MKTYLLRTSAFLLAGPLHAVPALAEDAPGEEIVVLASGFSQPAGQTGQAISVIGRDRLDELQSPTVADALRVLPSLSVIQRGPLGAQTSVFVRGANSSQTLVLIDGVRVNDPSSPNAAYDFGALSADNVQRIEVLRGPNSIIWGSQAIGGVINIETQKPATALTITAGGEAGAFDTLRGHANAAGSLGPVRYSLGGSLYRTDGISAFPGGTERDGSRQATLNGRAEVELATGISLDLRGNYFNTRADFDSNAANYPAGQSSGGANSLAEAHNRQWTGYAGLNLALAGGRLQSRLAYTRSDIRRLGTDPVSGTYNTYFVTGLSDRFEYRGAYDLAEAVQVVAGLEYEHIRASTSYEGFAPDVASNDVTGGYLQLTVKPLAGVTATGGIRHDSYTNYGGRTTIGGNLAYSPNGGKTVLRATYAEGFRAPTLTEGQPPYGNRALKPETARNVDVGLEQSLLDRRVTASVTWYDRRSTNLIVYSFSSGQSENVGRVDARGLEFALSVRPTDRLNITGGFGLVDAFNRSAPNLGKRLQLRPQHSAILTADWQTPLGLSIGGTLQMVGDSFDDAANTVRLDGYALASLRASLPVSAHAELYARVENVTDATYQTVAGYNTPGRSAYAGARVRF